MRLHPRFPKLQFAISGTTLRVVVQFAILPLILAVPAGAAVRVEAYRGEPFGIGRATIDLSQGDSAEPASDDRVALVEEQGRAFYPVIENKQTRRILRNFLGIEMSSRVTFLFMFRGDDPLVLTAYTPMPQHFSVVPEDDAEEFNELLDDWWEATANRYQQVFRQAEYPVVVENYLAATWARRLERQMPQPSRMLLERFQIGQPWMSKLAANEAYQTEIERDLLLGRFSANEPANIPLAELRVPGVAGTERERAPSSSPPNQTAKPDELPAPAGALPDTIEPLSAHVPHECFYMRFGNFPNYLWFRDFLRHWQGDLGNMVVMQSVSHNNSARFQQQIAVGESKIARVMGPAVIRDVAIIGLDAYMRDGAAMGILFQANNNALLKNNLGGQRQDAKARHKDAIEETVRIAGHDVSFIHTPDNRVRSFYALDGDFHLVANSRRLVERFFEAGAGTQPLAATAEFQDARAAMPLTRDDTIFLFIPSHFLQNLAGPHYRVELDRRLRSIGEMRALTLARLAAKAEGHNAQTIDELLAAELLPPGFGDRPDGSELVATEPSPTGRGQVAPDSPRRGEGFRDTLRGDPGWMTPIADMSVGQVTPTEARRFAEFQRELQGSVGAFAPIAMALKRDPSPANKGWDRITADIRVAPYSQMPIAKWPNMLGPAMTARVAPIAGDVASLEMVIDALGEPVHLFGGLRDFTTPLVVRQGEVTADAPTSEYLRAYIGGWPKPHLIERFLGRPAGPYDDDGIARTGGLFDLWLRRADDFFLFSFKRDVLMDVGPQLAMEDAPRPAQIRLRIDDLTGKQLATAVSGYGYSRARDASASGSRFMNSLTTQLHVAPQDARAVAEDLVAGQFACPLGGEYKLVDSLGAPDGDVAPATASFNRELWVSTAPTPENRFLLTEIPADYQMPLMNWFRGLSADVARIEDELWLNAQLDMVHIEVGPPEDPEDAEGGGLNIPGLGNLFSGFGKKTDDKVKPAAAEETPSATKK
jgi:hypothetical protein